MDLLLTPRSRAILSSLTTTSALSVASSNTSTLANTSPRSFLANASSNPTPQSHQSTTVATSSSSMPVSTRSPRSLVSPDSRPSRALKSTASTRPPRARSHTLATSTPLLAMTTPQSALLSRASGLRARTPCAPRPSQSSRLCAWSTLSSDTTFSVRFYTLRHANCMLTRTSPRLGRQAQARAQRQDAPCHQQHQKTRPPQQWFACRVNKNAAERLIWRYLRYSSFSSTISHVSWVI